MMGFALLCSGSKGNCFLLRDENTCLMVDCGGTKNYLSTRLEELRVSKNEIDALLITHTHSDHIAQLNLFAGVKTYSPCPIGCAYTEVRPGEKFQIEHLTVTPLVLSHDAEKTTGYLFESWQEKLAYITDTGYIRDSYLPLIRGSDYIILESNHDVEMLMGTRRPMYLKQRIAGDSGHLCNEDCAGILSKTVTSRTRMVVLAHISEQANTRETALEVTRRMLEKHPRRQNGLLLAAAGQKEMIVGGKWPDEKVDGGSCCCVIGMDDLADGGGNQSPQGSAGC